MAYHDEIKFMDFDHFCFESRIIGMARVNDLLKSDTSVVHYCTVLAHSNA